MVLFVYAKWLSEKSITGCEMPRQTQAQRNIFKQKLNQTNKNDGEWKTTRRRVLLVNINVIDDETKAVRIIFNFKYEPYQNNPEAIIINMIVDLILYYFFSSYFLKLYLFIQRSIYWHDRPIESLILFAQSLLSKQIMRKNKNSIGSVAVSIAWNG